MYKVDKTDSQPTQPRVVLFPTLSSPTCLPHETWANSPQHRGSSVVHRWVGPEGASEVEAPDVVERALERMEGAAEHGELEARGPEVPVSVRWLRRCG